MSKKTYVKRCPRQVVERHLEPHVPGVLVHLEHLLRDLRGRQEVQEVSDLGVQPFVRVPSLVRNSYSLLCFFFYKNGH